jgi:hypothetical protein
VTVKAILNLLIVQIGSTPTCERETRERLEAALVAEGRNLRGQDQDPGRIDSACLIKKRSSQNTTVPNFKYNNPFISQDTYQIQ